jgi:hypothetical protein
MTLRLLKLVASVVGTCWALSLAVHPGEALAVPTVSLGPGNVGIATLNNVSVVGTIITIEETWTSAAPGFLLISGLDTGVPYTVRKIIHNQSGVDWTRIANELLDPAGQANDNLDPKPYPSFVPAGFTTSNDQDGLSFDQFHSLPRTSSVFASVFADEFTDVRDFLDFFNGTLPTGATDNFMTYGLIDNDSNQPFLLSQRPNASSRVPEVGIVTFMGAGLVGIASGIWRRRSS